jgi:hypothetical protein
VLCEQHLPAKKGSASKKKQASEKLTEELLSQQSLPCTQLFSPVLFCTATGFEVEVGAHRLTHSLARHTYLFSLVSDFASVHAICIRVLFTHRRLAHSLRSVWIRLRCHRILRVNKYTRTATTIIIKCGSCCTGEVTVRWELRTRSVCNLSPFFQQRGVCCRGL